MDKKVTASLFFTGMVLPLFLFSGCGIADADAPTNDPERANVESWLGTTLPKDATGLHYAIKDKGDDQHVAIAMTVPDSYYEKVKKAYIPYAQASGTLLTEPGVTAANRYGFMKPPAQETDMMVSSASSPRTYLWYREGILYLWSGQ